MTVLKESSEKRGLILWSGWILVASVIFAGVVIAKSFDNLVLRQLLSRWIVLSMNASLLLIILSFFADPATLKQVWNSMTRRGYVVLAVIVVSGTVLVSCIAPRINRIYFDEEIYENIGQNIAWTGNSLLCDEGNAEYGEYKPFIAEYNKQPNGYPYFLSLFFRVFGISERSAHLANNVAYIIAILAAVGIGLALFEAQLPALAAGACLAATPMFVTWSNTASAESSAAAFSALAIFAACLVAKRPTLGTTLLLIGAITWGIQFRPESIFLFVPILSIIYSLNPGLFRRREVVFVIAAVGLLALPELLHLYAVRDEVWGSSGQRFSLAVFMQNISTNGLFYFNNARFPLVFSILGLLGLFGRGLWKEKIPIFLWFLYSWGIFAFFYAGSYGYGADVRFSLISAAPIAIFAGLGVQRVCRLDSVGLKPKFISALLAAIVGLQWIGFLPLIRAAGEEAVDARLDVEHGRELAKLVPVDSIVLSHNPSMWLMWGKNAAQMSLATINKAHVDNDYFARYKGGVYLHWNFWCNVPDPSQSCYCSNVRRDYNMLLIKGYDERGHHYALYRMFRKDMVVPQLPVDVKVK